MLPLQCFSNLAVYTNYPGGLVKMQIVLVGWVGLRLRLCISNKPTAVMLLFHGTQFESPLLFQYKPEEILKEIKC